MGSPSTWHFFSTRLCFGFESTYVDRALVVTSIRTQALGWCACLQPMGGTKERSWFIQPLLCFEAGGLCSDHPLSESSPLPPRSLWSDRRPHLLILKPGRAHAEPISVCRTFALKSFLAKLDATPGCLLPWEGASSADLCEFRIRPLKHGKGTVQGVSRLYHKVPLKRVQKWEKKRTLESFHYRQRK